LIDLLSLVHDLHEIRCIMATGSFACLRLTVISMSFSSQAHSNGN
jgi:hypothetical protein